MYVSDQTKRPIFICYPLSQLIIFVNSFSACIHRKLMVTFFLCITVTDARVSLFAMTNLDFDIVKNVSVVSNMLFISGQRQ